MSDKLPRPNVRTVTVVLLQCLDLKVKTWKQNIYLKKSLIIPTLFSFVSTHLTLILFRRYGSLSGLQSVHKTIAGEMVQQNLEKSWISFLKMCVLKKLLNHIFFGLSQILLFTQNCEIWNLCRFITITHQILSRVLKTKKLRNFKTNRKKRRKYLNRKWCRWNNEFNI